MNEYKAADLPADKKIIFQGWKIEANSHLSKGSVIFNYEYSGETRENKNLAYKSNIGGIIVTSLSKIQKTDEITSEYFLFYFV